MRLFILLTILFSLSLLLADEESQTEKAKKELDNAANDSDQETENNDEDDESCSSSCLGFILDPFFRISVAYLFNLNTIGEYSEGNGTADNGIELENITDQDYPYQSEEYFCFTTRNTPTGRCFITDTSASLGTGVDHNLTTVISDVNLHYNGWALRNRYRYLDEENAPYPIHSYHVRIERKSLASNYHDAGVSIGIGNIEINNKNYTGFSLGHNLEIFPFKPLSVSVVGNTMLYKNKQIYEINGDLRLHLHRFSVGAGYDYYSIAGIEFNTIHLKIGLYL